MKYSLTGNSNDNCITPANDLTDTTVVAKCVQDYNQYLETSCYCTDESKYFEPKIQNGQFVCNCNSCNTDECSELCFNPDSTGCTCEITRGVYWLRRDVNTKQTYCEKIPYLNFGNINTSLVKDMSYLFSYCENLTSIDVSKFDTSSVTDMYYMFQDCLSLTSLNFEY